VNTLGLLGEHFLWIKRVPVPADQLIPSICRYTSAYSKGQPRIETRCKCQRLLTQIPTSMPRNSQGSTCFALTLQNHRRIHYFLEQCSQERDNITILGVECTPISIAQETAPRASHSNNGFQIMIYSFGLRIQCPFTMLRRACT
jgi:hypothetical protein